MRNNVILSVDSLSKEFSKDGKSFKALDNVSFELDKGEVLGIIGRNGAGKSTLLKVLSRITAPSAGEISYEGQLTSIIDIGTGFHADLSGEENIRLNALLLGYSKNELKLIYDEIVEFSGLQEYMKMPVKHYSSGMYLRLAFSIAFHSNISILLLDEVIAVGDTDFKRKCYSKIKELKARGTAIVLVSHHLELIVEQCDRCILLDNGKLFSEGSPMEVVNFYYELVELNEGSQIRSKLRIESEPRSFQTTADFPIKIEEFQIDEIELLGRNEQDQLTCAMELIFRFSCTKRMNEGSFELGIYLTNMNGIRVLLDSYAFREEYVVDDISIGKYEIDVVIPGDLLSSGLYRVGVMMCLNQILIRDVEAIARVHIHSLNDDESKGMGSIIRPKLNWSIQRVIS